MPNRKKSTNKKKKGFRQTKNGIVINVNSHNRKRHTTNVSKSGNPSGNPQSSPIVISNSQPYPIMPQ